MATGNLSINSENIFPIIKKWLYSDQDIFVRELISNGCDAITKLHKLEGIGEYEAPEGSKDCITVILDEKAGTMKFIDTGIGMTEEEVGKYINDIAFSGAADFIAQYKDKTDDDQIIGHFGLGFYSAFMVADKVTIDTLSYKEGAAPVHWECDGGVEYTMEEGTWKSVGTMVTLYLNEDCMDYAKSFRTRQVIEKYCSFMPVEIYLFTEEQWTEYLADMAIEEVKEPAEEPETEPEKENGGEEKPAEKAHPERVSISDTDPLWMKRPNECGDEEYKDFYRRVFADYKEPLFWIHLNMDYPFNLKGILYFPRLNTEYDSLEGTIKLYNNRVFIADNIKEVIPEFLLLLKGVIDCPDLPLNVSRSALQNDGFVQKISDYITRKVADKLNGMCSTEREDYEKYWDDIGPFVKYGCLKDEKFYDRVKKSLLFKNLDDRYETLEDLTKETENTVVYVSDTVQQGQYIRMYKDAGTDAVILEHNIDNPFITMLEQKNTGLKFRRIDAEVQDELKGGQSEEELKAAQETLEGLFREKLGKEQLTVSAQELKDPSVASMITLSEESRRLQDMLKMYGMNNMGGPVEETLVLNTGNALVKYLLEHTDSDYAELLCRQLYDLAVISHRQMEPDELAAFIRRSGEVMQLLTEK